jgi:hypothetical protein
MDFFGVLGIILMLVGLGKAGGPALTVLLFFVPELSSAASDVCVVALLVHCIKEIIVLCNR